MEECHRALTRRKRSFFPLFDEYIYNLITTPADIRLVTLSVLQDFAADSVAYLELRTTPRSIPISNISKETYVDTVLDTVETFHHAQHDLHCNLILSIDRRNTAAEAQRTVDIALAHRHRGVVGIDLSGNPLQGDVSIFGPAFARAKANGLKITLHFGEVATPDHEAELHTLLDFEPDRLSHVIHVPEEIKERIRRMGLGLEFCLSCNVLARLSEGGYRGHHFGEWRRSGCPIALSVGCLCSKQGDANTQLD